MPSIDVLTNYAEVAVRVGVGLQAGDRLIISAPIGAREFTRMLVASAYRAGARNVDVLWDDDAVTKSRFVAGTADAADSVSGYSKLLDVAADDRDCFLKVLAENPNLLADQDQTLVAAFRNANRERTKRFQMSMASHERRWCVVAAPTTEWAAAVFPDLAEERAIESLWEAIFRVCRVDQDDPVAAWSRHAEGLAAVAQYLDGRAFDAIRYEGPGTQLVLGLPEGHRWEGGGTESQDGTFFIPNLPTEEVFTAPRRDRGEGVITATKPLNLSGTLVEGLVVEVSGGKVVNATASRGQEVLDQTLASDDGARHFGEVALVPQSSAVARERLIWHNMLMDENDASHIALGQSYPVSIEGGAALGPDELAALGMNQSSIHVDFVVGSDQVDIFGVHADGSEEPLLHEGEWAFEL